MSVAKRPQARIDLDDIAAHLAVNAGADVAIRFLEAVETVLEQIDAMPESGAPFECDDPRLNGIRHISVRGFRNHYVFYFVRPAGIDLVRVLHAKRDLSSILSE
ncbi:MAG: type II toxin-antitoxin system RelE/ParE family toxin [Gemmataceae bacterium]